MRGWVYEPWCILRIQQVKIRPMYSDPRRVADAITLSSMIQGLTAHYLVEIAQDQWLKEGDWCVVHAGAGGTGSLLVQMAKQKGVRVISTKQK